MFLETLGMVGGFITSLGMVFQVHKTIQEEAIRDISWGMLSLNIVGILMILGYSIATVQPVIYIPLILSIGCNLFLAVYKLRYTPIPKKLDAIHTIEVEVSSNIT